MSLAVLLQAKKLEAEVLAPMQRWTTAYNTVQARMNKLEGVRLEVDSRRRTVAELGQKIDKQRARLPQTKVKGEFDIEQTIKKVQHKENKLAGLLMNLFRYSHASTMYRSCTTGLLVGLCHSEQRKAP